MEVTFSAARTDLHPAVYNDGSKSVASAIVENIY